MFRAALVAFVLWLCCIGVRGQVPHSEVSVTDFTGVDITGATDSSPGIQNAIGTGNRRVVFPCGDFLLKASINIPSNTEIRGSGPCTRIKTAADMAAASSYLAQWLPPAIRIMRSAFSNADPTHGNSNILIHDLTIDSTSGVKPGLVHQISFHNVHYVSIKNVTFLGGGVPSSNDATSFTNSDHYVLQHNRCIGMSNACFDQWGGVHDLIIASNFVDNALATSSASNGILVNGVSPPPLDGGPRRPMTSYNVAIANNQIESAAVGINVTGLCSDNICGQVAHVYILANRLKDINRFHGIIIAEATDAAAVRNVLDGVGAHGISVGRHAGGAASTGVVLAENTIRDAGRIVSNRDAISLEADASIGTLLDGNIVEGNTHARGIRIAKGNVSVTIAPGSMSRGTADILISNSGTGTTIRSGIGGGAILPRLNRVLQGFDSCVDFIENTAKFFCAQVRADARHALTPWLQHSQ
jgi:hypothetical protein